jgi:hypothetical protein
MKCVAEVSGNRSILGHECVFLLLRVTQLGIECLNIEQSMWNYRGAAFRMRSENESLWAGDQIQPINFGDALSGLPLQES